MAQDRISPESRPSVEHRCPNCGTRVARDAETCFMCGHDLRIQPQRTRRVSVVDALLVLAVVAVLLIWWQLGAQPDAAVDPAGATTGIMPANVPVLEPTPTPTATPEPTPTPTPVAPEEVFLTHVVDPGETLLSIAGDYDVTVDEIRRVNNLDGDFLNVDQELIIPVLRTPSAAGSTPPAVSSEFTYTVKEGDTIVSIATLFGATVEDILQANGLAANDIIRPGDILVVPVRNVPQEVLDSSTEAALRPVPTLSGLAPGNDAIYIEPRLLGPPSQATIARTEPVLLRWVSVDVLAPNEWYVVLLYPNDGVAQQLPSIWTKATSHRLELDLAPGPGEYAVYSWQVSVVRVVGTPEGGSMLEAASPPSLLRSFTWE